MTDDEPDVYWLLKNAAGRAERARTSARALLDAGFFGPALVWAVRASEILMRDFVLAPYFMEGGETFDRALHKGSKILGHGDWRKAFAKVEEWYGPFDEPLTELDGNAWDYWCGTIVRRRGEVVHGNLGPDVSLEEAKQACDFADQMAQWFALRFMFESFSHPLRRQFHELPAEPDALAEEELPPPE